jgi:hypothetical protein
MSSKNSCPSGLTYRELASIAPASTDIGDLFA